MSAREMKHLILMRHAKSSWSNDDLEDHERPLNPRGKAGAEAMAGWLTNLNAIPNAALVSDATRTQETWRILSKNMGLNLEAKISSDLYLAGPDQLLDAIQRLPEGSDRTIVIAHQPGMSALVKMLSDGSEPASRSRAYSHFPTCATALIDIPVENWSELEFGKGVFSRFSSPNELATT